MHILIIGAGVIGVTTSYELIKGGHEVTIIDRQPEPAWKQVLVMLGLLRQDIPMHGPPQNYLGIYLNHYFKKRGHSDLNFNGTLLCGLGESSFFDSAAIIK